MFILTFSSISFYNNTDTHLREMNTVIQFQLRVELLFKIKKMD